MFRETRNAEAIVELLPPGFSPEVVLCFVATTPQETHPSGTAVMITPHCALTAKHVIDDYLEMTATPESELRILGRSGFVPKHQNRDWLFNQVVRIDASDIAVLVLASNQPPIFGLNYPKINLIPPVLYDTLEYGPSLYEATLRGKILASGIHRLAPSFREDGSLETLSLMKQ